MIQRASVPIRSAAERESDQIVEVAERLCREFAPDGLAAEAVRARVREARAGYLEPRVLTYLPVLVERTVRRALTDAATARRSGELRTGPDAT